MVLCHRLHLRWPPQCCTLFHLVPRCLVGTCGMQKCAADITHGLSQPDQELGACLWLTDAHGPLLLVQILWFPSALSIQDWPRVSTLCPPLWVSMTPAMPALWQSCWPSVVSQLLSPIGEPTASCKFVSCYKERLRPLLAQFRQGNTCEMTFFHSPVEDVAWVHLFPACFLLCIIIL